MSARTSWKSDKRGGYTLRRPAGTATVTKGQGRAWVLLYLGQERDLGRRASFDTAEREIVRLEGGSHAQA